MAYVDIIFIEETAPELGQAFDDAADFWNKVITSSPVSPLSFQSAYNTQRDCQVGYTFPAGSTIDGLAILSSVARIDGPGGILGQAGPCLIEGQFPRLGIMRFDDADVDSLVNSGQWELVIRHEMAHVVGIGTIWQTANFLQNPCPIISFFGCDPKYKMPNGIEGFEDLGGSGLVPVANTGGPGTANGHWRESTFDNELMTGYLNAGVDNPVSIMTLKSLKDIGYGIDLDQAEVYQIPNAEELAGRASVGFDLDGDILDLAMIDIGEVPEIRTESNQMETSTLVIAIVALVAAGAAVALALFGINRSRATKKQAEEPKEAEVEVSDLA